VDERPDQPKQALEVGQPITRPDILHGAAVLAGSSFLAPVSLGEPVSFAAQPQDQLAYYPPALTGLRGDHTGSFEPAHALRDGGVPIPSITAAAEQYDLVIVGGGISGLSAACFYLDARPNARILILENHDDFGGHAKRNEFQFGGRIQLLNGGTLEIDSPRRYSVLAAGLLRRLGVVPDEMEKAYARHAFYTSLGLRRAVFLDRDTFGADKLVVERDGVSWMERLAETPLTPQVREDIARIYESETDYLPGMSSDEKKARLASISYGDYLTGIVKADLGVLPFFQAMTHGEWGVGIDAEGALEVWPFDFPGFKGLHLEPGPAPRMGYTAGGYSTGGSDTFHFPDGNASIARLLVRHLIPSALPGKSAEDSVTARVSYAMLDRPGLPVRLRLNSIVLHAANVGRAEAPDGVAVSYVRDGETTTVRAAFCVLACWNMVIPFVCPELPERQKAALHQLVKTPLVYTSVAIRNWRAFTRLGISRVYAPGCYHSSFGLNAVVDIGGYRSPRSPDEPMLVHMTRTPCQPGLDQRAQNRAGRADLLSTSYETFEHRIRDQLGRTLGPGGFDPAADITAITINRWPHGYAYEYNPLFDPAWDEHNQPHVIGRQPFGRIAIANSDSGAAAYTDSAIDQAHRAIGEILAMES
jgi:spermidine dehydrogenase